MAKVKYNSNASDELREFFLHHANSEEILDILELTFRFIDNHCRDRAYKDDYGADRLTTKTLNDLNTRFKEHSLGYQYENKEILRVDSELIHAEVVKPVLRLLNRPHLKGAEEEYLNAHEHYRQGNSKEALVECLKAFESAMMGICRKRGWAYDSKDNAKRLIDICLEKGLVPPFWQSQLGGLRSMLEGSVPTGRNKLAGMVRGRNQWKCRLISWGT